MMKIFLDPGHGGSDPGAVANGLYEKNLTLEIAKSTHDYLYANYQGITVKLSRLGDETVSLSERTNRANAWGANLYVSIHINAGGGKGFESFIFKGNFANKDLTNNLRTIIHDAVVGKIDFVDRGKKEANFHVLRETVMPSVLTESGFIDNKEEARIMKSDRWLKEVGVRHAIGISQALKLQEINQAINEDSLYRVVAGTFRQRRNAESQVERLENAGFDSFILPV